MTSDEAKGKDGICETVTVQVEGGLAVINKCDYDANPDAFLLEGMTLEEKYAEIAAREQASAPAPVSEPVIEPVIEPVVEQATDTPLEPAGDEADAASTKAGKKKR